MPMPFPRRQRGIDRRGPARQTTVRGISALVVVSAVLAAVSGCGGVRPSVGGQRGSGPLRAVPALTIPADVEEVSNPLRGQYEDMGIPLFPQSNPAQQRYPQWPDSYDATLRVGWRELQPRDPRALGPDAPDDRKYDFSEIDDALAKAADRHMRLTLRVLNYGSCCDVDYPNNTNIGIPDWVRAMPGASTSYPGPPVGSSTSGVTQVVPNWNDSGYLSAFEQLLAALGRRYDRDERLSVFEFSGYGDWSENHNSYLSTVLGAPGPEPDESEAVLGYFSQWGDQNITKASIARLVAANVNAFPHTQLVMTPQNPEMVRQVLADDVTKKLAAPVGFRSDCLGTISPLQNWADDSRSRYVMTKDPLITAFRQRLKSVPVITEWCSFGTDPPTAYYMKGLHDVVKYHVSMTSSMDFPDADSKTPMDTGLYELWFRANVFAGYRYSVQANEGSQEVRDGLPTIDVTWTNYGSAAATEKWVPGYQVVDFTGKVIRTIASTVTLKTLVSDSGDGSGDTPLPASTTESVHVGVAGLKPGHYTLRASVAWQQHKPNASHVVDYPPMQLASDGRDSCGGYPIATFDVPRPTAH
jgi:hypothetical protein